MQPDPAGRGGAGTRWRRRATSFPKPGGFNIHICTGVFCGAETMAKAAAMVPIVDAGVCGGSHGLAAGACVV